MDLRDRQHPVRASYRGDAQIYPASVVKLFYLVAVHRWLELLKRDPFGKSADPDDQARGFNGRALPPGAKLWSKAGWTSQVRHDAAYIELPNGAKFVLVIFTTDPANEREIIPSLGRVILGGMSADKETAR